MSFHEAYEGQPPWDTGRPQPVFVELAEAGAIEGPVLDAGCGTGENALMLAEFGHDVTGVDIVPRAIEAARTKAAERGLEAEFLVHDALDLPSLDRTFRTVVDCGLFHVFDDMDRAAYVDSLAAVIETGGSYHGLVFSEHEPGDWGPRRIAKVEFDVAFEDGWDVRAVEPAFFETVIDPAKVRAWLATIERR